MWMDGCCRVLRGWMICLPLHDWVGGLEYTNHQVLDSLDDEKVYLLVWLARFWNMDPTWITEILSWVFHVFTGKPMILGAPVGWEPDHSDFTSVSCEVTIYDGAMFHKVPPWRWVDQCAVCPVMAHVMTWLSEPMDSWIDMSWPSHQHDSPWWRVITGWSHVHPTLPWVMGRW